MLFQYALGRTNMAHYNCALKPHSWLRAQVAEDKLNVPLCQDEAPNKQILRQIIRVNLTQALKIRNTKFTQHLLVQKHGAVVHSII